jgi:hypothetical protein
MGLIYTLFSFLPHARITAALDLLFDNDVEDLVLVWSVQAV